MIALSLNTVHRYHQIWSQSKDYPQTLEKTNSFEVIESKITQKFII